MSRTIESMAERLRAGYASELATGLAGPAAMFADIVSVEHIPPRSTDGWFDGADLRASSAAEAAALQSALPDGRLVDVQVITRADDQIIVVAELSSTLDGVPFRCPATIVYNVQADKIVGLVGLYEQKSFAVLEKHLAGPPDDSTSR